MKLLKKYRFYILSFFIPCFILFLFFFWKGCFTDKVIFNSDMQAQYLPLFQYWKNVLNGVASFPYTFSKGLGGAMYGATFYYLANPLNLLVYFFDNISLFLTLLVILKISLCGFTMYIFLKHKFHCENKALVLFSCIYALMNYNINYYVNFMWLDGVLLAPIIMLGIDKIIYEKKDLCYIISLFVAILLNYYIGYILVLFSVLYFSYQYYLLHDHHFWKEKKEIIHFLIVTFLIGCMSAFILLPCAIELFQVTRVSGWKNLKWINWNFLDFIAPFFLGFGNLNNPLNYFGFCMCSGTVIVPLVICYFTNQKIPKREKKATIFVYACLLLPIAFPILNMIWHMFTLPEAFNYRYSFLAMLFTLLIAYRSYEKLECSKKVLRNFYIIFLIFTISLGYVTVLTPQYYVFLDLSKIILTAIVLLISIILLCKKKKEILLLLMAIELVGNLAWIGNYSRMTPLNQYEYAMNSLQEFAEICESDTRCERKGGYTYNDALLGNYHGVSVFLSTMGSRSTNFLAKMSDLSTTRNYNPYYPDVVLDMFLGVKYLESEQKIPGYEVLDQKMALDKPYYVLKNPNALSIGYLVPKEIKNFESSKMGFFYLDDLLKLISKEEDSFFLNIPFIKLDDKTYRIENLEQYPYYYIYTDGIVKENGEKIEEYITSGDDYVTLYVPENGITELTFDEVPKNFKVYAIDFKKVTKLKNNIVQMQVDVNRGNEILGHINVEEESSLMFSIPYEQGWEIWVDGKETPYYEVLESLIAIDIKKGSHEIQLKYHVPGLMIGVGITVFSMLLLACYERRCHNR